MTESRQSGQILQIGRQRINNNNEILIECVHQSLACCTEKNKKIAFRLGQERKKRDNNGNQKLIQGECTQQTTYITHTHTHTHTRTRTRTHTHTQRASQLKSFTEKAGGSIDRQCDNKHHLEKKDKSRFLIHADLA